MRKFFYFIFILLVVGLLTPTVFGGWFWNKKDDGPKEFKYGELNPDGHIMTDTGYEFARLVELKSKGKIKIKVYSSSQLGDETTQIQAIQMGALDFFRPNTTTVGNFGAKKMTIFALPYIFRGRDHLWKVLGGKIGEEILKDLEEQNTGMVGIAWCEEGQRNFFFRKTAVTTLADLKGQKIRVPQNEILLDTVKALGGSPTPISYSELYTALQTGVVDGAENPPTGYLKNLFYEVAPNYSIDGHTYSPSVIVASQKIWNKLSDKEKNIILAAAKEAQLFNKQKAEEKDQEAYKELKKKGAVINEISDLKDWPKAVRPVYEKYGKEYVSLIDEIQSIK